jgi:hypothetical protein
MEIDDQFLRMIGMRERVIFLADGIISQHELGDGGKSRNSKGKGEEKNDTNTGCRRSRCG